MPNDFLSSRAALPKVGIADKVRFLSRPDSYPEHPRQVEVIETHFSWVFLTETRAYKLKKPVQGDGFDLRRVEERRRTHRPN